VPGRLRLRGASAGGLSTGVAFPQPAMRSLAGLAASLRPPLISSSPSLGFRASLGKIFTCAFFPRMPHSRWPNPRNWQQGRGRQTQAGGATGLGHPGAAWHPQGLASVGTKATAAGGRVCDKDRSEIRPAVSLSRQPPAVDRTSAHTAEGGQVVAASASPQILPHGSPSPQGSLWTPNQGSE
jgi:hypothetical protein